MRDKILEVIADPDLGGAPKHVLTLVKGLNKQQFEPMVICPAGWLSKECKKIDVPVYNLELKNFADFRSISRLRAKIKQENPVLIHIHGVRASWLGTLALVGLDKKMIYTEHLWTASYHLKNKFRELAQLFGLFFTNLFAKKIITPSKAVSLFLSKKVWVRPAKILVVPNGLDDFKIKKIKPEQKIGFIGSLNFQKGVPELIKAAKELVLEFPDLKLEIIGDGPLRESLENQALKLDGLIKFLGQKDNVGEYLPTWKLVAIPSISESFGQVALEAFIASRPVVASAVGGLPEVVLEDGSGILVRPADVPELVRAISFLLHNPAEAERMGRNGRKIYEKFFTAKQMIDRIEKIYKDTIGNQPEKK